MNTNYMVLILSMLLVVGIMSVYKYGFLTLNDGDLQGLQKFHENPTPRIAGIPIFISFFTGAYLLLGEGDDMFIWLLVSSLPVFIAGLAEDFTAQVSPFSRLLFALVSTSLAIVYLDIGVTDLGFETVDLILADYTIVSFLFTLLVVVGVVNAINIIDGYNGLMIGYSILVLLTMAYVANIYGDILVLQLSLLLISSLFGVFVFNFPFGKIFMGDGGAYFVGFMMAIVGLMLGMRNDEVSHWFILLLFIYPLYETVFSIYRKKIVQGISPSEPDGYHLHMLIYKCLIKCKTFKNNKVMCNSMTSPFLWALSLVGIIPAVVWHDNQTMLIIFAFVFMAIYTIIYRRIVYFKFK